MRTSEYSEEQIIGFSRQAEAGMQIKEIGRKHGFGDGCFCKWRSKYSGMDARDDTTRIGYCRKLPHCVHDDGHRPQEIYSNTSACFSVFPATSLAAS